MLSTGDTLSLNLVRPLLNVFVRQSKGFNVCYLNARSIRSNIDELRLIFDGCDIHGIVVSESWLSDAIISALVDIEGFNLFRRDRDRDGKIGGGVAIYVRKSFKVSVLHSSQAGEMLEFLLLKVKNEHSSLVLGGAYCPPREFSPQSVSNLEGCLSSLESSAEVLLCGDFNVNLLCRAATFYDFEHFLAVVGLVVVNSIATYHNANNPSQLDVALVRNSSAVLFHNQISPPSFLDHDLLFTSMRFNFSAAAEGPVFFRNFGRVDLNALTAECSRLAWPPFSSGASVDDKVDGFCTRLEELFKEYVPLTKVSVRRKGCPWFNKDLAILIAERELIFRRYKRSRNPRDFARFKALRNLITFRMRKAKQDYFCTKLDCTLPPRQLWSRMRQMGICRANNKILDFDPDLVNVFFTSATTSDSSPPIIPVSQVPYSLSSSFSFAEVSDFQVAKAIFSLKSSAVGSDNVHLRFLKLILPYALSSLTEILNSCIRQDYFPMRWKFAIVIPLPKKANPKSLSDLRPISILSCLGKVLERIMADQIVTFSPVSRILSPFQSGFRRNHSCETALVHVTADIHNSLDIGEVTFLVLLDFSKAFDSVDHSLLLHKLKFLCGFSDSATSLIREYLTGRAQCVRIGEVTSTPRSLFCGVPQGSILGPLLFSLFINDAPDILRHVKYHLYADDLQLYIHSPIPDIAQCVSKLNEDLQRLSRWASFNRLRLNPDKSVVLFIERRASPNSSIVLPKVTMDGRDLKYVTSARNLGIVVNNTLSCCDHVSHTLSKIYLVLRQLRSSASLIPRQLRKKLAISLVLPHFLFGSVVYLKLDHGCQRRLRVAFNDVIRYVWDVSRSQSVSHLVGDFVGYDYPSLIQRHALVLLFKISRGFAPAYLATRVRPLASTRTGLFLLPRVCSAKGERSYFVQCIRWWNSLTPFIRNSPSVAAFRVRLEEYLSAQHAR